MSSMSQHQIDWDEQPLGKMADAKLGSILGVSKSVVYCQRTKRNIAAFGHTSNEGSERTCIHCGRIYKYGRRTGSSLKACNSCVSNRCRFDVKERAVKYKGGKCAECGYSRCLQALDFHHLDPSQKDFSIAGSHNRSWEKIKAELDKCICLCKNCHAEVHAGIRKIKVDVIAS